MVSLLITTALFTLMGIQLLNVNALFILIVVIISLGFFFLELKYSCKPENNKNNLNKAKKQLFKTKDQLQEGKSF